MTADAAPETLDELFADSTELGKSIADLVAHAWKVGLRDGMDTAAGAIEKSYGVPVPGLDESTRNAILHVAEWLRLSSLRVEFPPNLPPHRQ